MSAFVLESTIRLASFVAAADEADFDPNTVTPGVVGFLATFLVAAAVVFIAIDMNRRVRRTNYRGEIRAKLSAEQAERTQPPSESDPRP